jgi:hypothetical protein
MVTTPSGASSSCGHYSCWVLVAPMVSTTLGVWYPVSLAVYCLCVWYPVSLAVYCLCVWYPVSLAVYCLCVWYPVSLAVYCLCLCSSTTYPIAMSYTVTSSAMSTISCSTLGPYHHMILATYDTQYPRVLHSS